MQTLYNWNTPQLNVWKWNWTFHCFTKPESYNFWDFKFGYWRYCVWKLVLVFSSSWATFICRDRPDNISLLLYDKLGRSKSERVQRVLTAGMQKYKVSLINEIFICRYCITQPINWIKLTEPWNTSQYLTHVN